MATTSEAKRIARLIDALGNPNGLQRERARKKLEQLGAPAVEPLIGLLSNKRSRLRWEACKTLVRIADPAAASSLVLLLQDESAEIQWLAAEALIALGKSALVPLLRALELHFDSELVRRGAHHVLHALEREGLLDPKTQEVLNLLRSMTAETPVPLAAHRALESLTRQRAAKRN